MYPNGYTFTNNEVEYYHVMEKEDGDDDFNQIEDYIDMIEFDFEFEEVEIGKIHKFTLNYDMILAPWMEYLVPKGEYDKAREEIENVEYNGNDSEFIKSDEEEDDEEEDNSNNSDENDSEVNDSDEDDEDDEDEDKDEIQILIKKINERNKKKVEIEGLTFMIDSFSFS